MITKKDLEKITKISNKNYIDLIQWLYNNHKEVLREYEKTKGNLQVEFLK
jgi:hypothetical protein